MYDIVTVYAGMLRTALAILALRHALRRDYRPAAAAVAAIALTWIPAMADRLFNYRLDRIGGVLYLSIIVMTIYMGNSLKFYDRFAWWDYTVHFMSGGLFVSMGIALADRTVALDKLPVLIFSVTFSLSLHVAWEVLEYLSDCIFHTDNQRWQMRNPDRNHQPKAAIQPAGLVDTMHDTMICILGTAIACATGWFLL